DQERRKTPLLWTYPQDGMRGSSKWDPFPDRSGWRNGMRQSDSKTSTRSAADLRTSLRLPVSDAKVMRHSNIWTQIPTNQPLISARSKRIPFDLEQRTTRRKWMRFISLFHQGFQSRSKETCQLNAACLRTSLTSIA